MATAASTAGDGNSDRLCLLYHPLDADDSRLNFRAIAGDPRRSLAVDLPSPSLSYLGSGYGWLLLYDAARCSPALFHPLTRRLLPLPSLLLLSHLRRRPGDVITMNCLDCRKVTNGQNPISDSPSLPFDLIHRSIILPSPDPAASADDVTVFLVFLHPAFSLAFANPRSRSWAEILANMAVDAICIPSQPDKLFAVKYDGTVCTWDLRRILDIHASDDRPFAPMSEARYFTESFDLCYRTIWVYVNRDVSFSLVLSPEGKIWRVKKEWKEEGGELEVKVHELVGDGLLREVESLGGCAVFVGGSNAGLCVKPGECTGVREDCVYFAEKCRKERRGRIPVGLYSLRDKRVEPVGPDVMMKVHPQPAWVMLPASAGEGQVDGATARAS